MTLILFLLSITQASWSQDSTNFSFAPAPVPYPHYDEKVKDDKLTGNYINYSTENIDLAGLGFSGAFRQVIQNQLAWDFFVGLNLLSGELQENGDMFLMSTRFQGDIEYQFFNNGAYSGIFFVGFGLDMNVATVTIDLLGEPYTSSLTSFLYSIPFGLQGGLQLNSDWMLAPFIVITPVLGGAYSTDNFSGSIEAFTSMGYGMDLLYEPSSLSVGTLLQSASDAGPSGGESDVFMFTLSWNKRTTSTQTKTTTSGGVEGLAPMPLKVEDKNVEKNELGETEQK